MTEINTHTSAIARDFYVRSNIAATVLLARQAFAGGAPVTLPGPGLPAAEPEPWGLDHPDGPQVARARWTPVERQYLAQLYQRLAGPDTMHRIFSLCLKEVKKDPAARRIFHARHVATTDRLKNGLGRCVNDEEQA